MSVFMNKWSFLFFVITVSVISAVPKTLNYQGKLLDSEGIGVNDTLDFTFRLYSFESGGESLWESVIPNVAINKGLFSVELTSFPESLDFSDQYYLEIETESEILYPREKLTSSPYSIRSATVDKALQSVHTSEDSTKRTGKMVFRPGEGAALSDFGDSIVISIGGTALGIVAEKPLIGDGTTSNRFMIDYDDITIGMDTSSEKLIVKDGGISTLQLTDGTVLREDLSSTLLDDLDDAVTLDGYSSSDFAPSVNSGSYIQNQNDSVQSGVFSIDGDGYIGGNMGIGTNSPSQKLHISSTGSDAIYFEGNTSGSSPSVATALILESNSDFRGRGMFLFHRDTADQLDSNAWYIGAPYTGGGFQIGNSNVHLFNSPNSAAYKANARLYIKENGYVGIGTNNPSTQLEVSGGEFKLNGGVYKHQTMTVEMGTTKTLSVDIGGVQGFYQVMVGGYAGSGHGSCLISWMDGGHPGGTTYHQVQQIAKLTQGNPVLGDLTKTSSGAQMSIQNTSSTRDLTLFITTISYNSSGVSAVVTLE